MMTKAEEMRKITDKANEQKRIERLAKHEKYASKITINITLNSLLVDNYLYTY